MIYLALPSIYPSCAVFLFLFWFVHYFKYSKAHYNVLIDCTSEGSDPTSQEDGSLSLEISGI